MESIAMSLEEIIKSKKLTLPKRPKAAGTHPTKS